MTFAELTRQVADDRVACATSGSPYDEMPSVVQCPTRDRQRKRQAAQLVDAVVEVESSLRVLLISAIPVVQVCITCVNQEPYLADSCSFALKVFSESKPILSTERSGHVPQYPALQSA